MRTTHAAKALAITPTIAAVLIASRVSAQGCEPIRFNTPVFTISVPVRARVDRFMSLYEQRTNSLNGGGFAKYLIFASFAHRI